LLSDEGRSFAVLLLVLVQDVSDPRAEPVAADYQAVGREMSRE